MKLSICCITYNHEKFIRQALHSFLQQVTNFEYEIIVCDDSSKDKTVSIIEAVIQDHPGKIVFFKNEVNIGMIPNFKKALNACKGEYIALCEGDDFWTDEKKLQKQVQFLDTNQQFAGCFHNAEERYEDDEKKASFLFCNYPEAKSFSFQEMSYSNLMPTCSVVFRNKLFNEFPEWFDKLKMGDWPLHLLNAQFGDFWYIPKIMAVHRLHSQSVWMLQDHQKNLGHIVDAYDSMIKGYEHNSILQSYLITAKHAFVATPQKTNLKRKVINFGKKLITKAFSFFQFVD